MLTNEEKKAWLMEYRQCGPEISRLEDEIKRWSERAQRMTAQFSDLPKGGSGDDKLQVCIEEIARLQEELAAQRMEEILNRRSIEKAIQGVPDGRLRLLLRYHYIEGMTFDRIAWCMNYSIDGKNVYRLHEKALSMLEMDTELHLAPVI